MLAAHCWPEQTVCWRLGRFARQPLFRGANGVAQMMYREATRVS